MRELEKTKKKHIISCRAFFLMISGYVAVFRCGSVEFWTVLEPPSTVNPTLKSKAEVKLYSFSCFILHAEKTFLALSAVGSDVWSRSSSYIVFMCLPAMFILSGVRSGVESRMLNSSRALFCSPVSKSDFLYSICI